MGQPLSSSDALHPPPIDSGYALIAATNTTPSLRDFAINSSLITVNLLLNYALSIARLGKIV